MNKYILPLYNRLDIAFIKGKKSLLFDENKKDYIDFISSIIFFTFSEFVIIFLRIIHLSIKV